MAEPSDHKQTVRRSFTKQADAYATTPRLTDAENVASLVDASGVEADDTVLEVGTGPGHVARGFARRCDEVVGFDLTEAPLAIAREKKREHDGDNLTFVQADAEEIPFSDNSFDVVCCRLVVHHLENPARVLQEMARVCRPDGSIAVEDLVVSEHSDRAAYQNRFERLRDPSHVRAFSVSDLIDLLTDAGPDVQHVQTDVLVTEAEDWLETAETPADREREVRELLERDAEEDLSGTRPFWQDGQLYFLQRTAIVVARNLYSTKS